MHKRVYPGIGHRRACYAAETQRPGVRPQNFIHHGHAYVDSAYGTQIQTAVINAEHTATYNYTLIGITVAGVAIPYIIQNAVYYQSRGKHGCRNKPVYYRGRVIRADMEYYRQRRQQTHDKTDYTVSHHRRGKKFASDRLVIRQNRFVGVQNAGEIIAHYTLSS